MQSPKGPLIGDNMLHKQVKAPGSTSAGRWIGWRARAEEE
jgi:hypothetical protein